MDGRPRRGDRDRHVLLSTVASDSHTWNLVFLQLFLEENGYRVTNLGACVPDSLVLSTARVDRPDAIVISTVNGHGHQDGVRLAMRLRADADTRAIPMMIGGKLGIAGTPSQAQVAELIDAGYDAVFVDSAEADPLHGLLTSLARDRKEISSHE